MTGFPELLGHWSRHRGEALALATIVRTTGSTYRKAGARMLIGSEGQTFGLLSGGCLEREIADRAASVLASGQPLLATFDTRRLLGCNGLLEVLIESANSGPGEALLETAQVSLAARVPLLAATIFAGGPRGSYPVRAGDRPAGFPDSFLDDSHLGLTSPQPTQRTYGEMEVLLQRIEPPVRLLIFGAGPDVVPLALLATQLGWPVTVVTHPTQSAPALPGACEIRSAHPGELSDFLHVDTRTAAVVMTHNYARDLAYLAPLFAQQPAYLGLLGPRGRREKLLGALANAGVFPDSKMFERFHSPAGLDLGADGPEEIALSIVAEIKAVLGGRPGGALRQRRTAIHAL